MDSKDKTEVRVIEGWMEHILPLDRYSGVSLFHTGPEKPVRKSGMDYTKVSLIIGDTAMPMGEVRKMVREMVEGVTAGEELMLETIAAQYNVTLNGHG